MNSGLLTGTQANYLASSSVADRVALSILGDNGGDGEIALGVLGESAILGSDDGGEGLGRDLNIVATLGESDTEDGAGLALAGLELRVNLEHEVTTTLLLLENLNGGGLKAGRDNTIRNLLANDGSGRDIDNVAESNHVTEAAHAIGTTGAGIGLGKGRGLDTGDIIDHVDLALIGSQLKANGSTGGRDVLEAGGGRLAESLLELLDEGPGVEGIEEVDVAGGTVDNGEGKLALLDVGSSRLLVGVGTITEREVLETVASILLAEEVGDGSIVVGGVLEGLEGIELTAGVLDLARLELLEELGVVVGVAQDGDTSVVLGGGADKGDTANIDLLDGLGNGDVDLGHSILEGVKVADDIVNLVDVLLSEVLLVGGELAGEDTGVDSGVEGLDATAQHLGGLCDGRDIPIQQKELSARCRQWFRYERARDEGSLLDREARLPDHLGGTARGEDTDIVLDEALGQVEEAGLVVDRHNGDSLVGSHCEPLSCDRGDGEGNWWSRKAKEGLSEVEQLDRCYYSCCYKATRERKGRELKKKWQGLWNFKPTAPRPSTVTGELAVGQAGWREAEWDLRSRPVTQSHHGGVGNISSLLRTLPRPMAG